jgi:hypothetical protein
VVRGVGIATDYGLDGMGKNPDRGKIFLSFTASSPALGPTQPPIQWISGAISLGIKRPDREAEHSPPISAEDKNGGVILPLPHVASWRSA